MADDLLTRFCFKGDFSLEQVVIRELRVALASGHQLVLPPDWQMPYRQTFSQVYITLFQRGLKPLRWGARKADLQSTLQHIVLRLKEKTELTAFHVSDPDQCRILFEMVTEEAPCNIRNLTSMQFIRDRFEPGITGLKYVYRGVTRYFMPTDAYVHSIMSVPQLLVHLAKKTGIAKKTPDNNERAYLMRREPIEYTLISSLAFISYQERVLPLFRGFPVPVRFNLDGIGESVHKSIDWLLENMYPDGGFLYFYDGYLDSKVDLDHPKMVDPLYNNILRHSGGTISLVRGYELTQESRYLDAARKSLDFLIAHCREHEYQGEYACYPFDNKKSKLGGAGIGLVAMIQYFRNRSDESLRSYIYGLVRHILSRVDAEGEMIGYYIHPQFNQGQPLIDPPEEVKKQLFSFYYPGEALLGLALFYLYMPGVDEAFKADVLEKSERALDFLVEQRPLRYREMFQSLPSDAWLMQAIEEWARVEKLRKPSYIDFVFNDAQAMIDHMYNENTAPIFDYLGGFYYHYGDHVYHDASRNEGMIAAYYLAKYLERHELADHLLWNMLKSAKGIMYTFHNAESTYAHQYPEKSINTFRFKLTRQWVRVDSVQHAVCFLVRLYWALQKRDDSHDLINRIDSLRLTRHQHDAANQDFELLERISSSGFSEVFKARSKENPEQLFAIKLFKHGRFVNFMETEISILEQINDIPNAVRFYGQGKLKKDNYLKFDLVEAPDLRKIIREQGAMDENVALKVIRAIVQFLKLTHAKGILHLDIKPENILPYWDSYTLIDWGLAKQALHVPTLYRKGDPIYLAPEMFSGYRNAAADIYALGAVLYFLLTGKHVYHLRYSDSLAAKIYAHFYLKFKAPANCSASTLNLLGRMLDKNPATRIHLTELASCLESGDCSPGPKLDLPSRFEHVQRDDEAGLYKQLAEDGVAFAEAQLGLLYAKGEKVPVNKQQAVYWFSQAASQNFAEGQCQLGWAYLNGFGVPQDYAKAFLYLKLAADQDHAEGQFYLGECFEKGLGVLPDAVQAENLYRAAARNGDKKAHKALQRLNIFSDI